MAGTAVNGPVVLLCPFCCSVLESIGRSYVKLGINIVTMRSTERDIPSICFHNNAASCTVAKPADGIKGLLRVLEDGTGNEIIHVITSCDKKYLMASSFPYVESLSAYQALCQR